MSLFDEIRAVLKKTGRSVNQLSIEMDVGYNRVWSIINGREFTVNKPLEEGLFVLGYRIALVKLNDKRQRDSLRSKEVLSLDDAERLRRELGYSSYGEMMKDVARLSDYIKKTYDM